MKARVKEETVDWRAGTGANGLPIWVKVKVPVTKAEANRYLGKRCKEYTKGCATCDGWKMFDASGAIPAMVERVDVLNGFLGWGRVK